MKSRRFVIATILAGLSGVAAAQQMEGPQPTTALVRVEDKRGQDSPTIEAKQITVKFGSSERTISAWQPIIGGAGHGEGTGVDLAVLIDDGIQGSFGTMLGEMQSFIQALPGEVAVGVGYMQNGRVAMEQNFTTEHDAAAKSLRLALGQPGLSASPYFCLSDFVRKWAPDGKAHIVLMITSGVDPYNGSTSMMNQNSPYVETALTDAQRAGVAVYSIYYTGAALRGDRAAFSGQSYLTEVAAGTGGRAYYLGTGNPPSFRPFLQQFTDALNASYRITFEGGGKGLQPFKVHAEGVKLVGPEQVMVGAY